MLGGKTPTTPTISSIIAGVQCQEAVKLLHGLPTMRGCGWVFEGISGDSYRTEYQQKEDCYSHETFDEVLPLDVRSDQITVRQFCQEAQRLLGLEVALELGREMLEKLVCPKCGREEPVFASLGRVGAERAFCPNCPNTRRDVVTFYKFDGSEPFADRTLREIGVPPFDIVICADSRPDGGTGIGGRCQGSPWAACQRCGGHSMGVSKGNKTATDVTRDLNRIAAEGWTVRSFPLAKRGEGSSVPVVVKRSVLDAIHEHGCSRTDVEVCGVLVGDVYRDENGPYVYVEAMIRGHHAGSQFAQVTFTAETWEHLQNTMDREYPEQRIIGWYHTHPGFGVFLSPMDLFIHENFFSASEQVAFVLDPLSGDQGMFVWRSGKTSREKFGVEEDVDAQSHESKVHDGGTSRVPASASQIEELKAQVSRLRRKLRFAVVTLVVVLILAVAGPFARDWLARWNAPVDDLQEEKSPHGQEPPSGASEDSKEVGRGNTLAPTQGQSRHEAAGARNSTNRATPKAEAGPKKTTASPNIRQTRPPEGSARPVPPKPSDPPKEP